MGANDGVREGAAGAATGYAPEASLLQQLVALAAGRQTTVVCHSRGEEDFKDGGLRAYARYRDLGVAAATGGLVHAQVVRMLRPFPSEARKVHLHATVFQMIYVLRGWIEVQLDGHEPQVMREGTCWTQPPSIKHAVLDYSEDFEGLEILLPADFETVTVG